MHLLQICNVGQIVGGTAACAWSVTRALPNVMHSVAFLSPPDEVTRLAFKPHQIHHWPRCTASRIQQINPDLVLLHNVSSSGATLWTGATTIQYVHSDGHRLPADWTVYCSRWLAEKFQADAESVLWQGVPLPPSPIENRPRTPGRLRIGRICTPTTRKWPDSLIEFYTQLAGQHPHVDWDFVGCPCALHSRLQTACHRRATFLAAEWSARSHVWNWDAILYHHPTLTESFGRTVADAARTGCIPIVDDRGGFTEQLAALGRRGCRTVAEFSDAIEQLSIPSNRQHESERIRHLANEYFSLASFGERLRTLIVGMAESG